MCDEFLTGFHSNKDARIVMFNSPERNILIPLPRESEGSA